MPAPEWLMLGFRSYEQYLQSDHWRQFRQSYRRSNRPKRCSVCGTSEYELHHLTYKCLGRETADDVVPLCREHHRIVHAVLRENQWPVEATFRVLRTLAGDSLSKSFATCVGADEVAARPNSLRRPTARPTPKSNSGGPRPLGFCAEWKIVSGHLDKVLKRLGRGHPLRTKAPWSKLSTNGERMAALKRHLQDARNALAEKKRLRDGSLVQQQANIEAKQELGPTYEEIQRRKKAERAVRKKLRPVPPNWGNWRAKINELRANRPG